jgi:hypothetical protein
MSWPMQSPDAAPQCVGQLPRGLTSRRTILAGTPRPRACARQQLVRGSSGGIGDREICRRTLPAPISASDPICNLQICSLFVLLRQNGHGHSNIPAARSSACGIKFRGSGKKFDRSSAPVSARCLRRLCWHACKPPSTTYVPTGQARRRAAG